MDNEALTSCFCESIEAVVFLGYSLTISTDRPANLPPTARAGLDPEQHSAWLDANLTPDRRALAAEQIVALLLLQHLDPHP
ncbi:hypothetical protein GCM10010401_13930 [Rarobacter faecitabidus]|uniref:hypothetical protein n=1 Tax=Rarobacter faecitabidus TaxID=13243 RepID=UPI001476F18E|nr:hypothetical protein [Rarobacter faecitabidus]